MEKPGHVHARCTQMERWSNSCPRSEAQKELSTNLSKL